MRVLKYQVDGDFEGVKIGKKINVVRLSGGRVSALRVMSVRWLRHSKTGG